MKNTTGFHDGFSMEECEEPLKNLKGSEHPLYFGSIFEKYGNRFSLLQLIIASELNPSQRYFQLTRSGNVLHVW